MLFLKIRTCSFFVQAQVRNHILKHCSIMANSSLITRIKQNTLTAEEEINVLKHKLEELINITVTAKIKEIKDENLRLSNTVLKLTKDLINLETENGIKQILVPQSSLCIGITNPVNDEVSKETELAKLKEYNEVKAPKDKKRKDKGLSDKSLKETEPEAPIDVGRLDMRVGRIVEVSKHPDADSLYVEKIDCGEAIPRTVVSGLVKFIPIENMNNRLVVLLCNLKPSKMRGVTSEAMVMCASTPENVEILSPPKESVPGDLVHCEGYVRKPDVQMNPKKKIFETVAPDLLTNNDLVACYKGNPLVVPGKGNVVSQTLKNVNVK